MGIMDFMALFQHIDPETRERLQKMMGQAMASGNVGAYLKTRLSRLWVDDDWHLELLGIEKNASSEDINKAYKNTAAAMHPDKCFGENRFYKLATKARDKALAEASR
jgi:DnaJ-domain-containing protein 1